MDFDVSNYLEIFLEESQDNLDRMNDALLSLEKEPENISLVNELFRVAHTLKGMAATMGFTQMASLTHDMENVLDKFRNQELVADDKLATILFHCLDILSEMVDAIAEGGEAKAHDVKDIRAQLKAISGSKAPRDTAETPLTPVGDQASDLVFNRYEQMVVNQARDQGYGVYRVKVVLEKACLLKAARAYLLINSMEKSGEIIRIEPTVEEIEQEKFDQSFEAIYVSQHDLGDLNDQLQGYPEVETLDIVLLDAEDDLKAGELPLAKPGAENNVSDPVKADKRPVKKSQSIRVDLDRLSDIMNLVSELVIYRSNIEKIAETSGVVDLEAPLAKVSAITSELQDEVLKIRMQPIELVFNRFPRMVRDLSKELGKEIELVLNGEDTELDRTVVSELGEPLVHLVRNAIGHGIEMPKVRKQAGKPPCGLVRMSAYQEGNRAVIIISDDGQGLDPQKLKEAAEKKGMDTRGLNDYQLQNIIFDQGFSTTQEVNSVSGRGVGMDVVREKINSLGGHVVLNSQVGQGTTFTIRLPLSLSIIKALLVGVNAETYAISLASVERVEAYDETLIKEGHSGRYFVSQEETIPIIDLAEALELEAQMPEALVVVKVGDKSYALVVSELYGQQDIVIKQFGDLLTSVDEYVGATILGDGMLALILDPANICGPRGETNV